MKGIIFKIFEEFVSTELGEMVWEELLESTTLTSDDPFVGPGTYPDTDLLALVDGTCRRAGLTVDDGLRRFGAFLLPKLLREVPDLVRGARSPQELLALVDVVIHVEVHKLWPDAATPRVLFEETGPKTGELSYRSKRLLCPLVHGLLDGLGQAHDVRIDRRETLCMRDGSDTCHFELEFVST